MTWARRLSLVLILCAAAARADRVVPARLAPWLDASQDQLVRRAYVPSPERRVGEVRILRRGDATVVQTLLYSKVLSQVVAEIRKKELANWPGNADVADYLDALTRVQKTIWSRLPADQRVADRRQKLWVEFVLAPDAALIAADSFHAEDGARLLRPEAGK